MAPRNEEQHPEQRPLVQRLFSTSALSKRSFRSHSSSFEADDERSTSPSAASGLFDWTMDNSINDVTGAYADDEAGRGDYPPPSYSGEDTRPTSPRELRGWYMYAFAAETYVICAIASFIPILLESLARENGVLLSDRTTPCRQSYDKTPSGDSGQCVVYVLGIEINTASFAMYTFSVSVLLQALIVVSISCAADHGNYRKKMLLAFAWIGSCSVMLYIFVSKSTYLLGALLAIVSNTSFGASFVLLNSFLPLLVRHHPRRLQEEIGAGQFVPVPEQDPDADEAMSGSTAALMPGHGADRASLRSTKTHEEMTSLELQLSTQISAKGIGIGYCAGLLVQCMAILVLVQMKNSTWAQRLVLFGIGIWWAAFTIPAAMWLRPRPGPPLPSTSNQTGVRAWIAYTIYAWKALLRTISLARRLLDIVLFLGAWFLLSDAIATTSSTAILFAKTQLHMEPWALVMISVISTSSGIAGAFSWAFISRRFGLKPHHTILACIAIFELIPLYGLLGYLPFVKNWGVVGLQQPWEMYPLAAVYGFVLGGLSGYCRSLYGELIPPGSEAAFYALYAITDKGSSVFGPAIVGAIIDASGEIRPAFWFLACLVGFPAPLIYFVDVARGKREGEKLAEAIEGFKVGSGGNGNGSSEGEENRRALLRGEEEGEDDEGEETERENRAWRR